MTKINSLYTFLKQQSQEKSRPLKLICDWDDCLQPLWPWIVFQASPDKNNLNKFPEYFEAYFNKDIATNKDAVEFIKKIKEENSLEKHYNESAETHGTKERYQKTPFTTIAEDLLKSLKEGLIDKLLIITSFSYEGEKDKTALWTCSSNNGKFEKFLKTFGKFSDSFFELTELKKNEEEKYVPRRWQRIEQLFSDFDIYIDDRSDYILEAHDSFSSDKIYVLPDYKKNKDVQGDNIFQLKAGISSLKDEEFTFDEKLMKKENNELTSQLQTEVQKLEALTINPTK